MDPTEYIPRLTRLETEFALFFCRRQFERFLAAELQCVHLAAPRFVRPESGLQDGLEGRQQPVKFHPTNLDGSVEIVHSLAKWKRVRLGFYDCPPHKGIYTLMEAIRQEDSLDETHSFFVDQFDWEVVIREQDRTVSFLEDIVKKIYKCMRLTQYTIMEKYPQLLTAGDSSQRKESLSFTTENNSEGDVSPLSLSDCEKLLTYFETKYDSKYQTLEYNFTMLPSEITFIHSEDLLEMFPDCVTAEERETKACEKYGAIFLRGIGHSLKNGSKAPHDLRAYDYDDYSTCDASGKRGLNGDILVYDSVRKRAMEISSMGIRVNKESLRYQAGYYATDCLLRESGKLQYPPIATKISEDEVQSRVSSLLASPFHVKVLNDELPLTVGGGIGQSRICMYMLKKLHIGEVQCSEWPKKMVEEYEEKKALLL